MTAPAAEAARMREAATAAFTAASAARQRHPHQVGISSVGRCRRATAYGLSRTPPSDTPPPRQGRPANLGTWQHDGLLPLLAAQYPDAGVEVEVTVRGGGLTLPGHIDLDTPNLPWDLKTVGEHRLQGVRRIAAAYTNHRLQVGAYAVGRAQAGRPPAYVGWYYLDRASGDEEIIVEPFTNALMLGVVDRLTELAFWAQQPDEAPRDERGPGLSFECDECPWLRRCWGDDAQPGQVGGQAARTNPEVEQALIDYDDARARAARAKQDKEYALARLSRARYGRYGVAEYGRSRDTEQDDPWAALRMVKELGLPVPTCTKRGAVRVKLTAPVPPQPPEGTTP